MSSSRLAVAAVVAALVACSARSTRAPLPRAIDCSSPAIDEYTQRVADAAAHPFWERLSPPAKESATIAVWLSSDGSLTRAEVVRASSEKARRHALAAVRAASPFPPPGDYAPCVVGRPLALTLLADRQRECDEIPDVAAYSDALSDRVLDHLDVQNREVGSERVLLRITLDEDGSVAALSPVESPSPEAAAKATAAVSAASPFPPPPEFQKCFAGIPIFVWLEVFTR